MSCLSMVRRCSTLPSNNWSGTLLQVCTLGVQQKVQGGGILLQSDCTGGLWVNTVLLMMSVLVIVHKR